MSNIEGIPEVWELARVGKPKTGEFFIDGLSCPHQAMDDEHFHGCAIIRRIPKPKQYRPFANASEFMAHPLSGDFIDVGAGEFAKVEHCNDAGIWLQGEGIDPYADAYHAYRFRDKSPFGVEVQS